VSWAGRLFHSLGPAAAKHRSRDHRLGVGTFLLVVNDDHAPILDGYGHTGLQKLWGHEFDLLGSRDVIGHVIIGLGICGFLLVVHCNHASILHSYGDMGPQTYWGHDFELLGSRDVIDHVTIGLVWILSYWWSMMTTRLSRSCTVMDI